MIGGLLPTYHCESLGAPFRVELVNCVAADDESITIPAFADLIATVAVERLRDPRRLGGPDVTFLRKCASVTTADVAGGTGLGVAEMEAYEAGERPMNAAAEKITRLYLHHQIRRQRPSADEDEALDFMDMVLSWHPTPMAAEHPVMRLSYQAARGWHRLK